MKQQPVPQFELRHRMQLALEWSGVSVGDMAAELGASRTTVSNYLHGRTKPRRPDLIVWAFKCGLPFDWLVNGADIPAEEATVEKAPSKTRRRVKTAP